jgi:hypothetical protein
MRAPACIARTGVKRQALRQVAAHDAQRAAHVREGRAGRLADQPVAAVAGDLAEHKAILAPGTLAEDGVVAVLEFFQQQGQVGRVVLQVAVHGGDDVAAAVIDAGLQRCRLAKVPAQAHHLDPAVGGGELLHPAVTAVDAAVVHQDQLVVQPERVERLADAFMQRLDIVALVLDRHDH